MKAFWWAVVIIALVAVVGASCSDDAAFKKKQADAAARVAAMPVKPPLEVVDMTATIPEAMPRWTDTTVMRDPETGCQYLKSASGDLEPRMAGWPNGNVAEYQMGCNRER